MDSNKIKTLSLLILAAFGALYLGITAATAQLETIMWVAGAIGLTVCVSLGRRVWLLLPLGSGLGLILPLPGFFSTEMISQIVVLGFSGLLFLMRKLPMRLRMTEMEGWCLLYLACVIQVFLRNPVGLSFFGTDSVGGKPYLLFIITAATAFLLSTLMIKPSDLIWWVRLSLFGSITNFCLGAIGKFVPSVGYFLGATFSSDTEGAQQVAAGDATRISFVRNISLTMALWISSRISPLKAVFHPLWSPLVLFSLAAAAFSGYRSQLIWVCLYFLVGLFYRGGIKAVAASFFIGFSGLFLLGFVNLVAPLPPNVQRALTFLPGTWDERFKRDAEGSTDWRIEMWEEALTTEKWIKNKWLGDGLGFTKAELDTMQKFSDVSQRGSVGVSGLTQVQESMMISGGYHSGPVQTIRTIGYVGLAVLLIGFFRVAVHAHRQIERSRDTEWFPVALFIGIPLIAGPIFWVTIIGSFDGGARMLLMGAALVSMLEKNLPLPAYIGRVRIPYVLPPNRAGASRQKPSL